MINFPDFLVNYFESKDENDFYSLRNLVDTPYRIIEIITYRKPDKNNNKYTIHQHLIQLRSIYRVGGLNGDVKILQMDENFLSHWRKNAKNNSIIFRLILEHIYKDSNIDLSEYLITDGHIGLYKDKLECDNYLMECEPIERDGINNIIEQWHHDTVSKLNYKIKKADIDYRKSFHNLKWMDFEQIDTIIYPREYKK